MGIPREAIATGVAVLALGTIASRALGLVREMVVAHHFGAGAEVDAYLIASIIPGVVINLVASAITAALIPVFTELRLSQGEAAGWRAVSTFVNLMTFLLIIAAVLLFVGAPKLTPLLGPGLSPEAHALAVMLTRLTAPTVILIGLIGVSTAVLNAYQQFTVPAFASLLYNTGIIVTILLLSGRYGIAGLGIGMVAGATAHLVAQAAVAARKRHLYVWSIDLHNRGVRKILALAAPYVIATGAAQVSLIADRIFAAGLVEGSISALNYAVRVMQWPLGVFAMSVGAAAYPALSEHAAHKQLDALRRTISDGIRGLWFIILPSTVGLVIVREPLVRLLFERGAFDRAATAMVSGALLFYALGLFAHAANILLTRAFFSLQDSRTPMKISLVTIVLKVGLSAVLVGALAHRGLALATTLTAGVNLVLLVHRLRHRLGHLDGRQLVQSSAKILLASAVMGLASWKGMDLWQRALPPTSAGRLALQLVSITLLGLATYLAAAALLRVEELSRLWKTLLRWRGGEETIGV